MPYWDTSAIVPVLVSQPQSAAVSALLEEDREPATSWLTLVEAWSAVSRLLRERKIVPADLPRIRIVLQGYLSTADEIGMSGEIRDHACRLVQRHPLSGADALHLAAALVWAEGELEGRAFICLDGRLRTAAAREGFTVLPPDVP